MDDLELANSQDSRRVLQSASMMEPPRPKVLWDFVNDQGITHFGASQVSSATVLNEKQSPTPRKSEDALFHRGSSSCRVGLKLQEQLPNVRVQSVCGGTDIVSCFLTGNPLEPIHPGQIQGAGLGMAVVAPPESQSMALHCAVRHLSHQCPFPFGMTPRRALSSNVFPRRRRYLASR